MKSKQKNRRSGGFTIVELMIASSISLVVTGMILSTYIQSMQGLNDSHQRMILAQQMGQFTNELSGKATRSNHFMLYKNSDAANIADENSRQTLVDDGTALLSPGGNLAVFVFYEFPKPTAQPVHRIIRLEAYSLTGLDAQGIGRVEHITIDMTAAPSTATVEGILRTNSFYANGRWTAGLQANGWRVTVREPFPMVRGLALPDHEDGIPVTVSTPRLFYMSANRNIVVMGQHYSGNANRNSNNSRTHTNAFSFNITPRT